MRPIRSSPPHDRLCKSTCVCLFVALAHIVSGTIGVRLRPGALAIIAMASSSHREKCKAKFKKGQKCLLAKFIQQGEDELLLFLPGEILRAEKRTIEVDKAQVASYHYRVQYVDDGKEHDDWKEESQLYKHNVDLLEGEESFLAEQARQHAWQQHDFRKAQARLEKIPERLRLRIPVALKKCVVEDYERACVGGDVDGVRPRVRGRDSGAGMDVDVEPGVGSGGEEKGSDGEEKGSDGEARNEDGGTGATTSARHDHANKDMSVRAIVKLWRTSMLNRDEIVQDDALAEGIHMVAESLLTYFNHGVRQFLLYPPEVPLYDELFVKKRKRSGDGNGGDIHIKPVDVYGVEHLVRLLVKLPELVCVQMMVLPMESARYIVAVEDWLMELMDFLVGVFFPDKQADRGQEGQEGSDGKANGDDQGGSEDDEMQA